MSQTVSQFNYEFCIICQDAREVLGHSTVDCPEVICKECFVKGHYAVKCPYSKESETQGSGTQGSGTQGSGTQGSGTQGSDTIIDLGSPRQPTKRCKRKISALDMNLDVCPYCRQVRDSPLKLSIHKEECEFYMRFIKGWAAGFLCKFCESFHEDIWDIIIHLQDNHARKIIVKTASIINSRKT